MSEAKRGKKRAGAAGEEESECDDIGKEESEEEQAAESGDEPGSEGEPESSPQVGNSEKSQKTKEKRPPRPKKQKAPSQEKVPSEEMDDISEGEEAAPEPEPEEAGNDDNDNEGEAEVTEAEAAPKAPSDEEHNEDSPPETETEKEQEPEKTEEETTHNSLFDEDYHEDSPSEHEQEPEKTGQANIAPESPVDEEGATEKDHEPENAEEAKTAPESLPDEDGAPETDKEHEAEKAEEEAKTAPESPVDEEGATEKDHEPEKAEEAKTAPESLPDEDYHKDDAREQEQEPEKAEEEAKTTHKSLFDEDYNADEDDGEEASSGAVKHESLFGPDDEGEKAAEEPKKSTPPQSLFEEGEGEQAVEGKTDEEPKKSTPKTLFDEDYGDQEAESPEREVETAEEPKRSSTPQALFSDDEGNQPADEPKKSTPKTLFDEDFGEQEAGSTEPAKKEASHTSLFDDGEPKPKKRKKMSLFDTLPEDEEGDMFDLKKKGKGSAKRKIDLLSGDAPTERKPRKPSRTSEKKPRGAMDFLTEVMGETPAALPVAEAAPAIPRPTMIMPGKDEVDLFGYADKRVRFSGPNEFRTVMMKRFAKLEKLVRSLDFSEAENRNLSSLIPDDVLKESVHRIVADLREKDDIIKEKEILIDFLQESVDSTFERDELTKEQKRRKEEIEEEAKETMAAQSICDELNARIEELQKELDDVKLGADQSENDVRQLHEEEMYKMAMLVCDEQEPMEQQMKLAKNEKMQIELQLMPMLEENKGMKAGIDVESFEAIEAIKAELPKLMRTAIKKMEAGVAEMLDGAFNPLREYRGNKIQTAVRNALQAVGKKVLLK